MFIDIDDHPPTEASGVIFGEKEMKEFEAEFQKIEATVVMESLVSACYSALQLRGIAAAIADPEALQSDKTPLQEKYEGIETEIRTAIRCYNNWKK